jgi:hypothetical protein
MPSNLTPGQERTVVLTRSLIEIVKFWSAKERTSFTSAEARLVEALEFALQLYLDEVIGPEDETSRPESATDTPDLPF